MYNKSRAAYPDADLSGDEKVIWHPTKKGGWEMKDGLETVPARSSSGAGDTVPNTVIGHVIFHPYSFFIFSFGP